MGKLDVNKVYNHFVGAMLWSSSDEYGEAEFLDENHEISDVDPDCEIIIKKKIKGFLDENENTIDELGISEEMVGHDLWLDPVGHGAGFWDRGYGEKGKKLSKSSKKYFKDESPEVGDDGKIRLNVCRMPKKKRRR